MQTNISITFIVQIQQTGFWGERINTIRHLELIFKRQSRITKATWIDINLYCSTFPNVFPVWAYWKVNMLADPQWKTQACVHKRHAELLTVSASPEGQYSSHWESNGLLTHPKKETVQNRLFRSSVYLRKPQPKCIPSTRGVQKPLFVSVSVSVTVKAGLLWHNKHQQPQTDKYFLGFIVILPLCSPCWWL